jgi:hypothetical protein
MAYNNASEPGPKQAMWPRMMSEFNDEAKAWIKKMSSTPTSLDLMEASSEAGGDVAELRKHIDQLRLGNDKQLADAMEERLKERLAELARFKKNMPSIISDLGKVS